MSRHRSSLTCLYGAALVAFVASPAPVVAVNATTNATSMEGSRTITSSGVSIRVPGTWPVYDLAQQTSRCVRLDVHAVYLGHQGPDASCPARLLGKTEAMQIEPLDNSVTQPSSRAKLARSINGHRVRLDPAADVSHELVAAIDEAGALVTVSYGHDRRLADQVLNSLGLAPTVGGSSTPTQAAARASSATARPLSPTAPGALAAAPSGPFSGKGFDTCAAPSTGSMQAWLSSPYRAVGVYVGGANRACPDGNLSASWVTTVTGQGWSLIPIYVGLQAPCTSGFWTIDPGNASTQGVQAADDAVRRAQSFGLGTGTAIFFDMEAYPTGQPCSGTVMTFLAAWNRELHVNGYVSGVYSSLNSGIADLVVTPSAQPDVVWFARWDGNPTTSDPAIPSGLWLNQRLKQYLGGHSETYAGVTINIDSDQVNATLNAGPAAVGHSRAGAASWGPNRLDVFVRGADSALWHKSWNGAWSSWESLGGGMTSDPAVVSWGSNRLDVFVQGTDNGLWHKAWTGSNWTFWESLGGGLTSGPAVVSSGANRLDVFVRGGDSALWHQGWAGSGWSGWEPLDGGLTSEPAVASWGANRLDVFVRGGDSALWHKSWNGAWSYWESLGGGLTSDPAVASWGANRLDVLVRGGDSAVWHLAWTGSSWTGWESLGGGLTSDPAVASWGWNRLDVLVRGGDNGLWHKSWAGAWSDWESLGGNLASAPDLVSWGPNRLDVFTHGGDNALWHVWWDSSSWNGWESEGGVMF